MRYAYYPGCSQRGTAKEFGKSAEAVCAALDIELEEIPGWSCCGATPAHNLDWLLSIALAARNLALAKPMEADVAVVCAACFSRLKTANYELRKDPALREEIAEIIGENYSGEVKVRHLLEIIEQDFGLDKLGALVTKELKGLKVASYYGCLLTRPPEIAGIDDPEEPTIMERLMEKLGAEPVDWSFKTECCGANLVLSRADIVLRLVNAILEDARSAGADCIAVACPLCHSNLDMRQGQVEKRYGVQYNLPILFFTQLLGLALGLDEKTLGFKHQVVDPRPMLKKKGLL
jgi:heterodisulfide reductase subunit B